MNELELTIEPNGIMSKFRTVLVTNMEDIDAESRVVVFEHSNTPDETYRAGTEFIMSLDDFADLGSPEEITVSIEPGNKLQEEYEAEQAEDARALGVDDNAIGAFGANSPETSRKAAINIHGESGTKRREIYDYIVGEGILGATDEEIQRFLGMVGDTERPRRGELSSNGYIVDSGSTRDTISGNESIVWVATDK